VATAISGLPQGTIRLSNGIEIETSPLSQAGDGGALVVDEEGYAIGIVVAGSETKAILAPIQDVLDSLGVRLVHIGQELLMLLGHKNLVLDAVWSPDGTRVATASQDDTARLWDARTGEELVALKHRSDVNSVAFSPDGRLVVTASQDKTARVWDAVTGEKLAVLRHEGEVLSAAFSPNGSYLVTASADGTARLWDTASGELLFTLEGHTDEVLGVAWSPDGVRILTAGGDGTARIWQGR